MILIQRRFKEEEKKLLAFPIFKTPPPSLTVGLIMSETTLTNYLLRMSCTLLPEYGGKELCMDAQV